MQTLQFSKIFLPDIPDFQNLIYYQRLPKVKILQEQVTKYQFGINKNSSKIR